MHESKSRDTRSYPLADPELEAVARRAAEIVMEEVYSSIGKSVVRRAFVTIGIAVGGLSVYLASKGYFK